MTLWRRANPEKAENSRRAYENRNREELNRKRRAYRKGNPHILQRQWLKKAYGVTIEWFEAKLAKQNGRCAICGIEASKQERRLHVDHNHTTGQNRGLLCVRCNVTLERVESVPKFLEKAKAYLAEYEKDVRG